MSKICERCGKRPVSGKSYARRGLAKAKGGVGRKVTGKTNRRFVPNIQIVRVRETNGTVKRLRVCAKCLKAGLRNGTITKATRKPRVRKQVAEPVQEVAPAPLEHEGPGAQEQAVPREGRAMSASFAEEIDEAYEEEKTAEGMSRVEEARERGELPIEETSQPLGGAAGVTDVEGPPEEAPPEPPDEPPSE